MKDKKVFIKIMFGFSLAFEVLFALAYIIGIIQCGDIYSLLDCTLPFVGMAVLSMIGLGITQHIYIGGEENKKEQANAEKSVKNYEKRYIIKTYSREGVQTKRINVRGDYGLLKSA